MNNRLIYLPFLGLILAACNALLADGSRLLPLAGIALTPTTASSPIPPLSVLKTPQITGLPILRSSDSPTPFVATNFADFPESESSGEQAKDFSAHLLGGAQFRLSEQGEDYILVLPTVIGCGECMFEIDEIAIANEA
ncbi:MAG TPA: hypothetical protein PLC52_11040 [Anaerolineales bacterium]|nr:hypothetical protein [Anaerolineales bacterium]HRQ93381.1 hypothetical protein [Anaerolineales bacterium]